MAHPELRPPLYADGVVLHRGHMRKFARAAKDRGLSKSALLRLVVANFLRSIKSLDNDAK